MEDTGLELDQYRLPVTNQPSYQQPRKQRMVPRIEPPFLLGPIPLVWFQEAMKLSKAALSAGIILWYFRGLKRSLTFKLGIQDLANRISRSWVTAQRALLALERKKLIDLDRADGRKHVVTILKCVQPKTDKEALQNAPESGDTHRLK